MTVQQKIAEMKKLQKKLNDNTNGDNWEHGTNKFDKKIDWKLCILLEMAELIESLPWKHWKSITAQPDWQNILVELVDIWHFIMSQLIAIEKLYPEFKERLENSVLATFSKTYPEITDHYKIINKGKALIHKASKIELDEEAEEIPLQPEEEVEIMEGIIELFWELALNVNLDLDTLVSYYNGKNCLNQFRQDNGYKEGTYIKEWDGEEDNVFMCEIIENSKESVPFDAFYSKFTEIYSRQK